MKIFRLFPLVLRLLSLGINQMDAASGGLQLQPLPDLCADTDVLNLNDFLISPGPGVWTVTPTLLITAGILDPFGYSPGVYVVTFTLDDPEPNCPSEVSGTFNLIEYPEANIVTSASVCNSSAVGMPSALNFDEFNLSNSPGKWTAPLGYPGVPKFKIV